MLRAGRCIGCRPPVRAEVALFAGYELGRGRQQQSGVDTSDPKNEKEGDTKFTTTVSGYYQISFAVYSHESGPALDTWAPDGPLNLWGRPRIPRFQFHRAQPIAFRFNSPPSSQ
jgi:hypothetical protein